MWLGTPGSEPHLKFKLHLLLEEVTHTVSAPPRQVGGGHPGQQASAPRSPRLQEDWVVFADADQFHIYPAPSLPDFLALIEAKNFNHVQGFLQERVARGGELVQVRARVRLGRGEGRSPLCCPTRATRVPPALPTGATRAQHL